MSVNQNKLPLVPSPIQLPHNNETWSDLLSSASSQISQLSLLPILSFGKPSDDAQADPTRRQTPFVRNMEYQSKPRPPAQYEYKAPGKSQNSRSFARNPPRLTDESCPRSKWDPVSMDIIDNKLETIDCDPFHWKVDQIRDYFINSGCARYLKYEEIANSDGPTVLFDINLNILLQIGVKSKNERDCIMDIIYSLRRSSEWFQWMEQYDNNNTNIDDNIILNAAQQILECIPAADEEAKINYDTGADRIGHDTKIPNAATNVSHIIVAQQQHEEEADNDDDDISDSEDIALRQIYPEISRECTFGGLNTGYGIIHRLRTDSFPVTSSRFGDVWKETLSKYGGNGVY